MYADLFGHEAGFSGIYKGTESKMQKKIRIQKEIKY